MEVGLDESQNVIRVSAGKKMQGMPDTSILFILPDAYHFYPVYERPDQPALAVKNPDVCQHRRMKSQSVVLSIITVWSQESREYGASIEKNEQIKTRHRCAVGAQFNPYGLPGRC